MKLSILKKNDTKMCFIVQIMKFFINDSAHTYGLTRNIHCSEQSDQMLLPLSYNLESDNLKKKKKM